MHHANEGLCIAHNEHVRHEWVATTGVVPKVPEHYLIVLVGVRGDTDQRSVNKELRSRFDLCAMCV